MNNHKQNENWNQYIGSIWREIFKEIQFPKKGKIIEIAPGYMNKIGVGLQQYGYKGTIYIIEPNKKSLDTITEKYNQLEFNNVISIQSTLDKAIPSLPECDAIVSNHPLDDIIIGKFLDKNSFDKLFDNHYESHIDITMTHWENLCADSKLLDKIKKETINDWNKIIEKVNPKIVLISQYESHFFQSNNLINPDIHAIEVLQQLRLNYSEQDYSKILVNNKFIEKYENWMIIKRK